MFYLGIDQHANQLTINLGNEAGDEVWRGKVPTSPSSLYSFLRKLAEVTSGDGGFMAIVEVTAFNDYLLALLPEYGCQRCLLVQPLEKSKRKTDRRDARQLRDDLWVNRKRIIRGERLANMRVVTPASPADAEQRQLTSLIQLLRKRRTQTINRMHVILKKHNLQHGMPTKKLDSVKSQAWLETLELKGVDRLEVDLLQDDLIKVNAQCRKLETELKELFSASPNALIVATTPGLSVYSSCVVASRIGVIDRFANGNSVSNFLGLTPSCRNSDAVVRHGKVTRQGSSFVRHMLCQAVYHALRKDAWLNRWYKQIKKRRGTSVARVAVMRRLATTLYAMLRDKMPYVPGGPERYQRLCERKQREGLSFEDVRALAFTSE